MWHRTRPRNPDTPPAFQPTAFQPNGMSSILKNLFKSEAKEIHIDDVSAKDAIIAVMGPTGSGKSSFIELATGITGIVGHGLASFTHQVSAIKLSFPGLVDSDICFIDTPGFDDTNKSDVHIFKMISDWLVKTYKRNIRLSGLLYFHRISDNRMAGTPLKNLRMFEKLCGEEFDSIILTTTMWNEVDDNLGNGREDELKTLYWKSMTDRGSHIKRFLYTRESAFEVLAPIFDRVNARNALLLQKEVNDLGLKLKETSAGKTLYMVLGELIEHQQGVLEGIRRELKEPMDSDQLRLLMEEYQNVSVQLQRANDDMRKMKISPKDQIQRFARTIDWKVLTALPWSGITRFSKQRLTGESSSTKQTFAQQEETAAEDGDNKAERDNDGRDTGGNKVDGSNKQGALVARTKGVLDHKQEPDGDNPDLCKVNREGQIVEERREFVDGSMKREEAKAVALPDTPGQTPVNTWARNYLPWVESNGAEIRGNVDR